MKNLFKHSLLAIAVLLTLTFTQCNSKSAKKNPEEHKISSEDSLKKAHTDSVQAVIKAADKSLNDVARFMAGMGGDTASMLKGLIGTQAFADHKNFMDAAWNKLDSVQLTPERKWAAEELKEANTNGHDLWYPFSGPDYLNASILFPNAKNYYFTAVEPIGELPDFKSMKDADVKKYFTHVHNALKDVFEKSYFITSHMGGDMLHVKGVLPTVYIFMARNNNQIIGTKKVMINKQGQVVDYKASVLKDTSKGTIEGVRIDFLTIDKSDIHSFYYFRANIGDNDYNGLGGLKSTPEYSTFAKSLGKVNSYVKAASYLMHADDFSMIRDLTMAISDVLLQDDTGIAFRFFNKSEWKIQLYGKYGKPVKNFPWIKEKDLEMAYKTDSSVKPLPFHLGYHWATKEDNEILATRIKK
ncbi:MAG: hypothetical protein WCL14_01510 [Bacteroidota bacterium]